MKIVIEVPDMEELYGSNYAGEGFTGEYIKDVIIEESIKRFADNLFHTYMKVSPYGSIKNDVSKIISENQKEIVEEVINRVSKEVLRKRAIANEMPKKSEIDKNNKEWEEYFIELIDKAIAKRFK